MPIHKKDAIIRDAILKYIINDHHKKLLQTQSATFPSSILLIGEREHGSLINDRYMGINQELLNFLTSQDGHGLQVDTTQELFRKRYLQPMVRDFLITEEQDYLSSQTKEKEGHFIKNGKFLPTKQSESFIENGGYQELYHKQEKEKQEAFFKKISLIAPVLSFIAGFLLSLFTEDIQAYVHNMTYDQEALKTQINAYYHQKVIHELKGYIEEENIVMSLEMDSLLKKETQDAVNLYMEQQFPVIYKELSYRKKPSLKKDLELFEKEIQDHNAKDVILQKTLTAYYEKMATLNDSLHAMEQ
ncbi:hypothetical protein [Algivirga pacifica]|uniref:Uncharacterized protein n=1 Tax=Algivirga pacifica TaxID=1162670 RepID=A0ABP9D8I2_9BACT